MDAKNSGDNRSVSSPGNEGFTLVELLVTVSLIAILATLAAPYFRDLILANKITAYTNELVQAMHVARIEAAKRTRQIRVSALDSSSASNEWGPGLVVYFDVNGNSAYNTGVDEEIRRLSAVAGRQTVDSPDGTSAFDFLPSGGINPASMTFNICDYRSGEVGRSVSITTRGQVRASDFNCT